MNVQLSTGRTVPSVMTVTHATVTELTTKAYFLFIPRLIWLFTYWDHKLMWYFQTKCFINLEKNFKFKQHEIMTSVGSALRVTVWKVNQRLGGKYLLHLQGQICQQLSTAFTLVSSSTGWPRRHKQCSPKTMDDYQQTTPLTAVRASQILQNENMLMNINPPPPRVSSLMSKETLWNQQQYKIMHTRHAEYVDKADGMSNAYSINTTWIHGSHLSRQQSPMLHSCLGK
jgi:hypothetical protein